jgi:hypothetical protein
VKGLTHISHTQGAAEVSAVSSNRVEISDAIRHVRTLMNAADDAAASLKVIQDDIYRK